MVKKFNYLNVPSHWEHYWTKYPEGYTILEALLNWVGQVDNMIDNVNEWNEYLDDFVATFDKNLQGKVVNTLSDWQDSGFLDVVIDEALQTQMDVLEQETHEKLNQFSADLAQNATLVKVDDSIQAILDLGGNIILEKGKVYHINTPLRPQSNQKINLNGATLLWDGSPYSAGKLQIINLDGLDNVEIYNGVIDGNRQVRTSNQQGISCIQGVAATNCHIHDIQFIGFGASSDYVEESGIGVHFEANDDPNYSISSVIGSSFGNIVERCTFDDIYGKFGIRFKSSWDEIGLKNHCYNNIARNNRIKNIGKSGIEIAGLTTHECKAEHNIIEYALIDGIDIDKGAYNCTVAHNEIWEVKDGKSSIQYGGITIQGSRGSGHENKVLYNLIKNVNENGISVRGNHNSIITGNIILSGKFGIYFSASNPSTECIVEGNIIKNTTEAGIYLGLSDANIIRANKIKEVKRKGIQVSISNHSTIESNTIEVEPLTPDDYSMYLDSLTNCNINNNIILTTGTADNTCLIMVLNSNKCSVTNSQLIGNDVVQYGIRLNGTNERIIISGNSIDNVAIENAEILLTGTTSQLLVIGNMSTVANNSSDSGSLIEHNIG